MVRRFVSPVTISRPPTPRNLSDRDPEAGRTLHIHFSEEDRL
jgi:hypothetical protein